MPGIARLIPLPSQFLAILHQIHTRGLLPYSSTSLLFFYLLLALSYMPTFIYAQPTWDRGTATVLALAIFALELLGPDGWDGEGGRKGYSLLPTQDTDGLEKTKKPSPLLRANIFSRLFISWNGPL